MKPPKARHRRRVGLLETMLKLHKDLPKAKTLHGQALAIREKVLGPRHPLAARALEGLAALCEETGWTEEAGGLAERARTIRASAGQK